MQLTFALLLAANAAMAFPMVKRQNPISSVVEGVSSVVAEATDSLLPSAAVASATSAVASVLPPVPAVSSASSVLSAIPSAAVSSAASAVPSAAFPGELAFPCADGSQLVYVERQTNVDAALEDVQVAVSNFTDSALFMISNATGGNEPGATRTVMIADAMANELLTNYTINGETGAIYQTWNGTSPATVSGITVTSYTTELQTYINDTETSDTAPVSTIKIFSNICATDPAAEAFFVTFFDGALQNGTVAAQNGGVPSASGIPAASSALPSVVESASSVLSSASSSLTAAVSSISSVIESATSQAAGAGASQSASAVSSGFVAQPTGAAGGALQVNTPPSVVQCQPTAITFNGGTGPYFLSVLPGGETAAAPLVLFAEQAEAGAYTWVVNVPAGTAVTLAVRDGTGQINYSSIVTVQQGTDSSCLPA